MRDGSTTKRESIRGVQLVSKQPISTLHEYVELVNSEADSDATPPSLFRGQREDWPLLPKLARLYNDDRLKWTFRETERRMLEQFSRQARAYVPNDQTDWDWLALAQHHGMATRMLDWTENPLLALWFAVQNESKNGRPGVVWIFGPASDSYVDASSSTSPFASKSTKVLQPRHSNMRLRVQSGWFTVHHFREHDGRFIQLERHKKYGKQLKKIEIDGAAFSQLRCDLDRCGVNAGTMFPDVTGLAQHVEWQCTLLEDER